MPTGMVRPYNLTDVLMTINDQVNQVQQTVSGSVTGISVVAEDDESTFTLTDTATGIAIATTPTWGNMRWGSGAYQ